MHDELPQQHGSGCFLMSAAAIGVFAIGFALLVRSGADPSVSPQIGKSFPPIEAAGWINGPGPTADDLRGQVVVVDAWAYWCGPCRMATPYIIELYKKYKDRGVIFIGLTSEGTDAESIKESRHFVTYDHVPWPNGYAAIKTLSALNVEDIPQFWVVDRQHLIVLHEAGWSESTFHNLDNAILKALDGAPPEPKTQP